MRLKLLYFMAGLLVATSIGLGALAISAQAPYSGQRWDYITVYYRENGTAYAEPDLLAGETDSPITVALQALEAQWQGLPVPLNEYLQLLGADGWELFSYAVDDTVIPPVTLIFKRPLP